MTPVVYVAGPFIGSDAWAIEQNIRRAESVALELWRTGYAPVCPHSMNRFFFGTLPEEQFLEGVISIMLKCDMLLLMPDWERSAGAHRERMAALQNDIPVYYSIEELLAVRHR